MSPELQEEVCRVSLVLGFPIPCMGCAEMCEDEATKDQFLHGTGGGGYLIPGSQGQVGPGLVELGDL